MRNYFEEFKKDRIIILNQEINSVSSDDVVSQLLILNSINQKPISLYLSSPGGSVYDALKIIDMINMITSPVFVFCTGLVASAGVLIAVSCTKGQRSSSENCTFMIHQPSTGFERSTISDLYIGVKEGLRIKELTSRILCKNTGQSWQVIEKDVERDFYMTSYEANQYGIIDKVILNTKDSVTSSIHSML